MGDLYDAISARFTAAERAVIDEHAHVDPYGTRDNALSLTVSWAAHVDKLERDRALPWDDHSVWNEHDLVATMIMRDRLVRALGLIPTELAERLSIVASEVDERFRSFTIEDSGVRITRIANLEAPDTPVPNDWWWHRVPVDGPVAIDLSHYDDAGNYVGPAGRIRLSRNDADGNYVGQSEGDESKFITPPVGHDDSAIPGSQAG